MSTSPISLNSGPAQTQGQSRGQQIMQDFKQLASSLQSGDLTGAQQAYTALEQLLPNQDPNSPQAPRRAATRSAPTSRRWGRLSNRAI